MIKKYDYNKLFPILELLLCKINVPSNSSKLIVNRLIRADLEGHPSHGVMRIPWYMDKIREREIKPVLSYSKKFIGAGIINIIDGEHSIGQIVGDIAVESVIETTQIFGVGVTGIKNVGHLGRLSDYVKQIAEKGYIGLMFTSIGGNYNIVAPYGSNKPKMGTNPMAFAAPVFCGCVVLDMSTAVHSFGTFEFLKMLGYEAEEECIIDSSRNLTSDIEKLFEDGAIIPFGGYKGYGLNFMIEILTGILLEDGFIGIPSEKFSNPSLLIAINPDVFGMSFKNKINTMVGYLRDGGTVLYPGEIEILNYEKNIKEGIVLPDEVVEQIQMEINRYNLGLDINDCVK